MKTFLLFVLAGSNLFAQTAYFPQSVAPNQQLGIVANGVNGTLNNSVQVSDTSLNVRNGTCTMAGQVTACNVAFQAGMFITLDNEIMQVCSLGSSTGVTILNLGVVTSSCPSLSGRGLDGTQTVTHNSLSSPVRNNITAWTHMADKAEIQAMETGLLSSIISVKWYGAKGDGTTDDTAAIQAALTAGVATGRVVYFPDGQYLCNQISGGSVLSFLSNTNPDPNSANHFPGGLSIVGSGRGNSTIITTQTSAPLLTAISTVGNNPSYSIKGIALLGPCSTTVINAHGTCTSGDGLVIKGSATPVVNLDDVLVQNFYGGKGFDIENVENFSFNYIRANFNLTGFNFVNIFAGVINLLDATSNKSFGMNISGGGEVVFNSPVIQGTYNMGASIQNFVGSTFNSMHLEDNNVSGTSTGMTLSGPFYENTFINLGQYTTQDTLVLNGGSDSAHPVSGNAFISGNHNTFGDGGPPYAAVLNNAHSVGNTWIGWNPAQFDTGNGVSTVNETFPTYYAYNHQATGSFSPNLVTPNLSVGLNAGVPQTTAPIDQYIATNANNPVLQQAAPEGFRQGADASATYSFMRTIWNGGIGYNILGGNWQGGGEKNLLALDYRFGEVILPKGIREGCYGTATTNNTCGIATLSAGTKTVSTTQVNNGYGVRLTYQSCSSCGTLNVGTIVDGTSFVIHSSNGSDGSNVFWEIVNIH